MKNPIFWLAFAGLLVISAYALLYPSERTFDALNNLVIAILMGKFALEQASNGHPPK